MGVSGIFLKATSSQILAFQCDREFLPVAQSLMHATINPYVVFDLLYVFIDDGVRVCVGLWRGFKFSVRGPQN